MKKYNSNPAKGMRDFLPKEKRVREHFIELIRNEYKKNGFNEIETPIIENISNISSSKGGENLSLMFNILKRGSALENIEETPNCNNVEKYCDLALRYDLTVPLSRFYANNHDKLPKVFKSIQIGNVFRAERPQKGRYRNFIQCDIDIIGEKSIIAETELIMTTFEVLKKIGLNEITIKINDRKFLNKLLISIGFEERLFEKILIILDKCDKIGIKGVQDQLINEGLNKYKVLKLISILSNVSDNIEVGEFLNQNEDLYLSLLDIKSIIRLFTALNKNISIVFDPFLIRGMGYYTGIIFEVIEESYGLSIAGGGRYDNMIGRFMNENIPACGFSIGFERIYELMLDKNLLDDYSENSKVAILYDKNSENFEQIFKIHENIKKQYENCSLIPLEKKMNRQLKLLKEDGYTYYLKQYDNELKKIE